MPVEANASEASVPQGLKALRDFFEQVPVSNRSGLATASSKENQYPKRTD